MFLNREYEQLIARYLNGTFDDHDNKKLMQWLDQADDNKKLFFEIKDAWDSSLRKQIDADRQLTIFYKNKLKEEKKRKKKIQWWSAAAGIAAVVSIGILSILLLKQIDPEYSMLSFNVPLGSRSEVVLADGSVVNLNSGSSLKYPSKFINGKREVILSGEAFFDVRSDKKIPFVVKTSDFEVTVTGTEFNICSYNDDNFSSVALIEGSVNFSSPRINPVQLSPGEKIMVNRSENKFSYISFNPAVEVAWKNGEFNFSKIAFPELIKRLERWYDIKIIYESKDFDQLEYSGSFKNQETIWQVLEALKLTSPIDYERIGHRKYMVIFKP